jgi:hypothetical protein
MHGFQNGCGRDRFEIFDFLGVVPGPGLKEIGGLVCLAKTGKLLGGTPLDKGMAKGQMVQTPGKGPQGGFSVRPDQMDANFPGNQVFYPMPGIVEKLGIGQGRDAG